MEPVSPEVDAPNSALRNVRRSTMSSTNGYATTVARLLWVFACLPRRFADDLDVASGTERVN
jgi:hypothetical protein